MALICDHSSNNSSCEEEDGSDSVFSDISEQSQEKLVKQTRTFFSRAKYERTLKFGIQIQDKSTSLLSC